MIKKLCFFLCSFPGLFASYNEEVFTEIWRTHYWGGDSLSGTGSDLVQTEKVRTELPQLLQRYHCKTMVDAPCGDFYWMQQVDLPLSNYVGIDIVRPLVLTNQLRYGNHQRVFMSLDIMAEVLPKADLILCRDCLGHFSNEDIDKVISLFKKSGSTYLLTTSFTENHSSINSQIHTGEWRPVDLRKEPFNFPEPLEIINENCTVCENAWNDKCLFLWKLEDLP